MYVLFSLFNVFVVCRIRAETGELTGVDPDLLTQTYMAGWAPSTLRAYGSAYKGIVDYGLQTQCPWPIWGSGEVSGYLIHAKQQGFNENQLKKFGAVLGLLFGALDKPSPASGPLVSKVKIGVLKTAVSAPREPRALWTAENLNKFVTALNSLQTSLADWRILALQVLCYFTVCRFDDLSRTLVGDVRVLQNGDIKIKRGKSKTDQLGRGSFNYVSGQKFGDHSVPQILDTYVTTLKLKSTDYLFPQLSSYKGQISICKSPMSYTCAKESLKRILTRLGLTQVSLHSACASAATAGAAAGLAREDIKSAGGWKSSAVEAYIRHRRPQERLQIVLFQGFSSLPANKVVIHSYSYISSHW